MSAFDPGCVKTSVHERRAQSFVYCLVPTTVAEPVAEIWTGR